MANVLEFGNKKFSSNGFYVLCEVASSTSAEVGGQKFVKVENV